MGMVCGDREEDSLRAAFQMGCSTLHTWCAWAGVILCPGHLCVNFQITNVLSPQHLEALWTSIGYFSLPGLWDRMSVAQSHSMPAVWSQMWDAGPVHWQPDGGRTAVCRACAVPFGTECSWILTLRSLLYRRRGSGGSERLNNVLMISQLLSSRTKLLNPGLSRRRVCVLCLSHAVS